MLFCQSCPRITFIGGLISHSYKRAITMSIENDSGRDQSKRLIGCSASSQQINKSDPDPEVGTDSQTGHKENKFTENDMAIHKQHREACEAKRRMYVDPSSRYKVFTEFAHRQRGTCCGSACRHCPYGQVNVKDPANKKTFNSLFYI